MLDIKWIRDNPEALDAALAKRGAAPQAADADRARREAPRPCRQTLQDMQARRNAASKEIGEAMAAKDMAARRKAEGRSRRAQGRSCQAGEEDERGLTQSSSDMLSRLPNIPLDDVPVGKDENDNVEHPHVSARSPAGTIAPKEHFEIGEALG